MIRIFLSTLLCSFLYVPVVSLGAIQETGVATPVQVVVEFQKVPHYEMFCADETRRSTAPIKIGKEFESFLSKELLKLFMWEECDVPKTPPHDESSYSGITWDIRFGISSAAIGEESVIAENIRVQPAKPQAPDKTTVKVLYDFGTLKNLTTTYTLIREDGHWKIDDIAPKGDFKPDDEDYDTLLEHSDSIKTDMQKNFRAALARYEKEKPHKAEIKQVLTAFLKLPYYVLFCKDQNWEPAPPDKMAAEMSGYLDKEFARLFLWTQCGEPALPPRDANLKSKLIWDIRYGVDYEADTGAALFKVDETSEDIDDKTRFAGDNQATVLLKFHYAALASTVKREDKYKLGIVTYFKFIKEEGHWKIDDIKAFGNEVSKYMKDFDKEPIVEHSDSIKTDMQKNYRAAEERYQKEQTKSAK